MSTPVIFLTFANDPDEHLALLKRERKNIVRALRQHDTSGQIKVVTESGTTVEDIFETFNAYKGQVSIFHYGGHASGAQLRLEDDGAGNANANATGLAQFLGQQEGLELVFLNGCATGPQVKILLDNGVKAVIATSSKIQDQMAMEFAEQFYYALSTYATIDQAFNTGTAFVKAKYHDKGSVIQSYRGLGGSWGNDTPEEKELPWGLYVADGSANWSIPQSYRSETVLRNRMSYEERPDVNDTLIENICEDLSVYSADLNHELDKENFSVAAIIREIVDCFPLPIGEQLRKLFTRSNDPDKPDAMELFTEPRLWQLYRTYRSAMQFISYILMSQLWDEKYGNPSLNIDDDDIVVINSFFSINENSYEAFDYQVLIRAITDVFDHNNIEYFLEELKQLKINISDEDPIRIAHTFMEEVRLGLVSGQIPASDLESLCLEAELHLANVLSAVAFLAKYKLATIKNIELVKRRHEEARYRHNHIELNRAITVASTKVTEIGEVFDNFTDNKSVLFLKTKDNAITGYLSMSPFIIDVNALENEHSSKLYLFAYEKDGAYCYEFLNNHDDPKLEVNNARFSRVKSEIEKFKANMHGIEFKPPEPSASKKPASRFSRKRQS